MPKIVEVATFWNFPTAILSQNIKKFALGLLFQSEKKHWKETALAVSAKITAQNRHWLRRLNGNYGEVG